MFGAIRNGIQELKRTKTKMVGKNRFIWRSVMPKMKSKTEPFVYKRKSKNCVPRGTSLWIISPNTPKEHLCLLEKLR